MRGASWAVTAILLAFSICNCQSLAAQDQGAHWLSTHLMNEAKEHSEVLWSAILTKCGDNYYYDGSGLDNLTADGKPFPFDNGQAEGFTEYKGVRFFIAPPLVSPADAANAEETGDADGGTAVMVSTLYRTGSLRGAQALKGGWRDGPLSRVDAASLVNSDPSASVLTKSLTSDALGPLLGWAGLGGTIAVHMEKRGGKWYYNLIGLMGSINQRAEEELMDSDDHPVGFLKVINRTDPTRPKFAASHGAPIRPISCDAMPGQPASPGNSLLPKSGVPRVRTRSASTNPYTPNSSHYEGDFTGFSNALPGFIDEAAAVWNLPPHSFDKEAENVSKIVELCASITPEIAATISDPEHKRPYLLTGSKYLPCQPGVWHDVSDMVRSYDHQHQRGIMMQVVQPFGGSSWLNAKAITIRIMFTSTKEDMVGQQYFHEGEIVNATIDMIPAKTAASPN